MRVQHNRAEESHTHDLRIRSNINDLCTRIERDVTALSARCYVRHWAVENLRALQAIVWNLKQQSIKSCNEIKCYFFLVKLRKYTHLAWFLLSIWPISSFLGGFQVFVAAFYR